MKTFTRYLEVLVLLVIALVVLSIFENFLPWYSQSAIMKVRDSRHKFYPGDTMRIDFSRRALVGFEGRVVRELVRLHDKVEEEVWKVSYNVSVDAGQRDLAVFYRIPTRDVCPQMGSNTYIWRGNMTFKPWGLAEKTYFFESEKFQIGEKNKS